METKEKKEWYKKQWAGWVVICIFVFLGLILAGLFSENKASSSSNSNLQVKNNECLEFEKYINKTFNYTFDCSYNNYCDCKIENSSTILRLLHFNDKELSYTFICSDGTSAKTIESCEGYKIGEPVIAGTFTWKVTKVEKMSQIGQYVGNMFMGKEASGEYLVISVEVENIGKSAEYLSGNFLKLVDNQSREFSADSIAALYLKPDGSALSFEQVNPGITKKGKIVFDVPKGLKVVNVRISSNLLESSFYNVKLTI